MIQSGPFLSITFSFDRVDWPNQIERVLQILESDFPGNPIDCAIVFQGSNGVNRLVDDRKSFLKARTKTKLCRFTLNNHFSCIAASGIIGQRYLGHMGAGGTLNPDGRYALMVFFPPNQSDTAYDKAEHSIREALGLADELLK